MRAFIYEAQYALRRLRRSPMFTVAATLTLAIAIGATAAVFSMVDGVLLKTFPYRDPDRLLTLWESDPKGEVARAGVAPGNFFDWQVQHTALGPLAAATSDQMQFTVVGMQEPERLNAQAVTANYCEVLGITPVLGRPLSAEPAGAPTEVMISYGYWQRKFGGAPSVLGRTLTIDNPNDQSPPPHHHSYTIVGVMPAGLPGLADMWTRIYFEPVEKDIRNIRYLRVYGRLKPGVTRAAAQQEMATIAQRLAASYPQTNAHWSVATIPLLDDLVGEVRPALVALLCAAACVLLIGAANLANLFLVRYLARQRELAVRTALGATRRRLVEELLAEAVVLSLGAGAIGVAVAFVSVGALRTLAPPTLPRLSQVGVDARVVAFCAVASLATVFIFGVLPAWRASHGNLAPLLKEGGRGTGSARQHRLQDALVVLQVAVALVLLVGAGLFVKSFAYFHSIDPGFQPDHVLTAELSLPAERYTSADQLDGFFSRLLEELPGQPGITAASVSAALPGGSAGGRAATRTRPFAISGDPAPEPGREPAAYFCFVSPDYFRTMGIPLRRGRGILPTDGPHAVKVAVIDDLLSRRYFAGRDPLGQRLVFANPVAMDTVEIVGIVGSVKQFGLQAENVPLFYTPFSQSRARGYGVGSIAVRASGNPERQTRVLESVVHSLDATVPVSKIQTLSDVVAQSVGTTRFSTLLASLFAVLALILGSVGIYSVLAYVVAQRQREIGVRIALGANRRHVIGDVARRALALIGVGLVLGMGAAWMLTRVVSGLFIAVSPHEPGVFVGAAVLFIVIALVASSIPAWRTTRVNPLVALTST